MIKLILFASLSSQGNAAGFWKRFCDRYLVTDDPYQFQHIDEDWLVRSYRSLGISTAWGNRNHLDEFKRLGDELRSRRRSPAISDALSMFKKYEPR